MLRWLPCFAGLTDAARSALAAEVTPHQCRAGTVLARRGERGDALFVVVHGRVRILTDDGPAGEAGTGEVVGEVALLGHGVRAATAVAIRDCELLRLDGDAFRRLARRYPSVLTALSGVAVGHLTAPSAAGTAVRTIAVVAEGPGASPLGPFCRQLAHALRALGPTVVLTSSRAGEDGVAVLDAAERGHRFVIIRIRRRPSPASERCLRQADCVLAVADASATPARHERRSAQPRRLVLVHPPETVIPSGTAAWLDGRDVVAHHHVRDGNEADFARLGRLVAGQATALVLSGGGARGFAHLGVMRALDEQGVAIDAVAGTSIGALMGATLAMGWDDGRRVSTAASVVRRSLLRPTLPMVALSSARAVTSALRQHCGELDIEDLWLPFFCVSTSLSRAEPVLHERGPLWLALRASASLPGIMPPVFSDGDLLVDGGLTDNLPIGAMRARVGGRIVAVDLDHELTRFGVEPFSPTVSGWRVLGQRLSPFRQSSVPLAHEIMGRAKDVAARWAQRQTKSAAAADVVVRPRTDSVGALAFRQGPSLIDAGRLAGIAALATVPTPSAVDNEREEAPCCS